MAFKLYIVFSLPDSGVSSWVSRRAVRRHVSKRGEYKEERGDGKRKGADTPFRSV